MKKLDDREKINLKNQVIKELWCSRGDRVKFISYKVTDETKNGYTVNVTLLLNSKERKLKKIKLAKGKQLYSGEYTDEIKDEYYHRKLKKEKEIASKKYGFDKNGFNCNGVHRETGNKFDLMGYDSKRYDREGFNKEGIHKITKTKFNETGFSRRGIHKETGSEYNRYGYDKAGYDKRGFSKAGIHRVTKTRFNTEGNDRNGINKTGENKGKFVKAKEKKKTAEIAISEKGGVVRPKYPDTKTPHIWNHDLRPKHHRR